ncbi:polysaccharide deacetylase family protein [Gilvibacter sp.]|uniref:polysaccharide deacetylase family protein n=1 Tax=Gilvibacter sp. TaxID=2729997 RepID=UPI003F4A3CE9
MKYTVKSPKVLQMLYPKRLWRLDSSEKVIYLTFDDGPIPEITPWVLETLRQFNAKATFFCIGDNVRKHPEIYRELIQEGHRVANHTMHHVKGWKTPLLDYLRETESCQNLMEATSDVTEISKLFRPPYGQLRSNQSKALQKKGYKIVMWDVLSADFDLQLSPEKCKENVIKHAKAGSIVVFHDSLKAAPRLQVALPAVLKEFSERGFAFKCIP